MFSKNEIIVHRMIAVYEILERRGDGLFCRDVDIKKQQEMGAARCIRTVRLEGAGVLQAAPELGNVAPRKGRKAATVLREVCYI